MPTRGKISGTNVPNASTPPDPSTFFWREIQALKELLQGDIKGVKEGIEIAHEDLVRMPTSVQEAVGGLRTLIEAKIIYENKLTALQFKHIEDREKWEEALRVEHKEDVKIALDYAFKTFKEHSNEQNHNILMAMNKNETSNNIRYDQLALLLNNLGNNLNDKIGDLKDRQTGGEGSDKGKGQMIAWILAAAGFLFGLISTGVLLFKTLSQK